MIKRIFVILTSCLILATISQAAHAAKKKPQSNASSTPTAQTFSPVAGEKRVALVIGNSAYTNSPLKNPTNDAKDMAAKLRALGFEVIERSNLKTKQIGSTLSEFRNKLSAGSVALVFYAGHGLQIKGENYLPAVDAEITVEEDVSNQSLSVRQIMDVLDNAKSSLNLVFLDACRNNPYARSFRSAEGGLARVSAPSGTLISYATRPGSVAADGEGRNGLYTSKLLSQMDSNQQIELSLKRVVSEVKSASQGKQEPWMEGSIEGDFCFGGCNTGATTQVATLTPEAAPETVPTSATVKTKEQIEDEYWEEIKDSGDIASLEQYRKDYPKGRYLNTAKIKITQLKKQGQESTNNTISTSINAPQRSESGLWAEVQVSNSKEDYEAYLTQYPKGKYVNLAKSRMKKLADEAKIETERKELEAWNSAEKINTEEAYNSYLRDWSSGKHAALAQVRLRKFQASIATAQASTPKRPQLPFEVSENVWKTIEASEYYRYLPNSHSVLIDINSSTLIDYDTFLVPNALVNTQTRNEITPISDRCFSKKITTTTEARGSKFPSELISYSCGIIKFDSGWNGGSNIDGLKGSLFPMKVGNKLSVMYKPQPVLAYSTDLLTEVVSRMDASDLDSRLTGYAWKLNKKTRGIANNITTEGESYDYYLEDLGVNFSDIGEYNVEQKNYVLPNTNTKTVRTIKDSAVYTTSYSKYDLSIGK